VAQAYAELASPSCSNTLDKHLAAMKILSHARRPGCVWPLGARAQQMALPKVEGHNSGERIQESTS